MAILIANIGTSDLVVGIEGLDYFLPVLFDRKEPNLDKTVQELTPEERDVWDHRNDYVNTFLCDELGIETTKNKNGDLDFSFREFSRKLLSRYEENPEYWHGRIRPGRIWGVIEDAISLSKLDKIIFLVTDQEPLNPKDTLHLHQILKQWFLSRYPDLDGDCFVEQTIPKHMPANDQDGLMQFFYQLLSGIDSEEMTLVSVKGGTPQMRQALQAQAIASGLARLVFIDPQLSIPNILRGNHSQCRLISYWRYTHTQKILTTQLLLDRWDFDGARQVSEQWEKTVRELNDIGVDDISNYVVDLESSTKALELGVAFLNLDYDQAKAILKKHRQQLGSLASLANGYNPLLNLYTQCRICVDLNEISGFLIKVSSLYEGLIFSLIDKISGEKYFDKRKYPEDLILSPRDLSDELNIHFLSKRDERKGNRLKSRFDKRDFLTCLVSCEKGDKEKEIYAKILKNLRSLDYWVELRNRVIHTGKGFSWETMRTSLEQDRKVDEDFSREACPPEDILGCLSRTHNLMMDFLRQPRNSYVGTDKPYYLYSDIVLWIEEKWGMSTSRK